MIDHRGKSKQPRPASTYRAARRNALKRKGPRKPKPRRAKP